VPILFVNGTNDVHYVLDSYMKSYNAVPGEKQLRIQIKMPHGHGPGWAPQEIGLFIDSKCRSGKPLPVPGKPVIEGGQVKLSCMSFTGVKKAELNYTVDGGLRSKREWTTVPATIGTSTTLSGGVLVYNTNITAPKPPANANTWYLTITDDRDAMVSTTVQFQ
jgi:hypothetical protein